MPGVAPNTLASRLTRVQSFQETVWGTSGLATARWMAINPTPKFTPIFKATFIDEDRGSFAPSFLSYVPELGGAWDVAWDATYEDILFALAGLFGPVTPTGGGPFVYTFNAPLTSAWSPQSYSLELAYDVATIIAQGCLTNKLSIKLNAKKNWTLAQSGFFQQLNQLAAMNIASSTNTNPITITVSGTLPTSFVSGVGVVIAGHLVNTAANGSWTATKTGASTFTIPTTGNGVGAATGTATQAVTPGIADRTVEPILFAGQTVMAIDNAGGAPGTTPIANELVSAQLDLDSQAQPFFTGDQKYPIAFAEEKWKTTLTLRVKWDAVIKNLYNTQWTLGNRNVFQLKATSGTKACTMNFAGVLSADPANYELDYGAITQELKFDGQYDAGTLANSLQIVATNSVAALP